jgi:ATP-dependent protease ClpP protease subunit
VLRRFYEDQCDQEYIDSGNHEFLISSSGGDVGVMLAMYDGIRIARGNTIGSGLLQSAAAVLFQAGKVRKLSRNALLLFHEPKATQSDANGPKVSDQEWTLFSHMVGLVVDRTGLSLPEAHDLFDGRFINAERAIQLNLADEIIELPTVPVYHQEAFNDSGNN